MESGYKFSQHKFQPLPWKSHPGIGQLVRRRRTIDAQVDQFR